jgi:hypothetical protein
MGILNKSIVNLEGRTLQEASVRMFLTKNGANLVFCVDTAIRSLRLPKAGNGQLGINK